jgi:CRISPR-associated endonuclease/helicase Cas3
MDVFNFNAAFKQLTGNAPFPWQVELYDRFVSGRDDNIPSSCDLPTGLGKTAVIAIWLIALANHLGKMPRRLVYVVNRRTVVDQTTDEVEKLRRNLECNQYLNSLKDRLGSLAISTLRGQFADNREWSADPCRPAVIVGTVDMIGSRLLFSGYGVGFKAKPLHAGFLGQDVLLVHDEAHLEPAFQDLLVAIEKEQKAKDYRPMRVMELSATPRGSGPILGLTEDDLAHPEVQKRVGAKKAIALHALADKEKLDEKVAQLALEFKDSNCAVLVFLRTVEDVEKVCQKLIKAVGRDRVQPFTGTMRGLERDRLARHNPVFARFLTPSSRPEGLEPCEGTAYLVCTSAGEVGVNISADQLVCDLSTFDSMAKRFGRANRFGDRDNTELHVVHPPQLEGDDLDQRRRKTLDLLRQLNGDGSPLAIGDLKRRDPEAMIAAFAPQPTILPTSDILFDSWALTTIRGKLPGRPPVEPYLHGVNAWELPETHVAWREEVAVITDELREQYRPEDLLEDFPLKPHELLRDRSDRVFKHLTLLAERNPNSPVWLLDQEGMVEPLKLVELAEKYQRDRINFRTILLPPEAGGLHDGMLEGKSTTANDVADEWYEDVDKTVQRRMRRRSDDSKPARIPEMRLIREIDTKPDCDDENEAIEIEGSDSAREMPGTEMGRFWRWHVRPRFADDDGSKTSREPVTWATHTKDAAQRAEQIVNNLFLPEDLKTAVILSARFHDLGKRRLVWQRSIGNPQPTNWLAKSGAKMKPVELTEYRHEFGSLLDVQSEPGFLGLSDDLKDLVLHLIAAHHGRGRPHFPADEAFDPEPNGNDVQRMAAEVPRRFAHLQRKYGRWGLAYLESLLRAADYAASADPSEFVDQDELKQ